MSAEEDSKCGEVPAPVIFRKKKPKSIRQRATAADVEEPREEEARTRTESSDPAAGARVAAPSTLAALLKAVDKRKGMERDDEEETDEAGKEAKTTEPGETPALAVLLRQRRKQQHHRTRGLEFRVERPGRDGNGDDDGSQSANPQRGIAPRRTEEEGQDAPTVGLLKRFAPQMGLRTDLVNRHM
jgi:hypothetical protein